MEGLNEDITYFINYFRETNGAIRKLNKFFRRIKNYARSRIFITNTRNSIRLR